MPTTKKPETHGTPNLQRFALEDLAPFTKEGTFSHTKGGVIDGRVGFEGSTNWSAAGEGTFVVKGRPGGPGYRAQNITLAVFTDPDTIAQFTAELVAEHLAARGPGLSRGSRVRRS